MVAVRRDGLVVETLHDGVPVFNPARSEATALDRSAALVFERCDGEHTIDSIRQALDDAGLGPSSTDAVWIALDELGEPRHRRHRHRPRQSHVGGVTSLSPTTRRRC